MKRFVQFLLVYGVMVSSLKCFAAELSGLNAIVTGGSRGIGEACCYALAKEGANIAVAVDRSVDEANKVANKIKAYGVDAAVFQCDVSDAEAVQKMVSEVIEKWGSIDILVNNAGIVNRAPAEELTLYDWQRMIDVNLTGVFLCSQAVGRSMIKREKPGSIINISSMCGHIVVTPQEQCHYHAAKGGVGMLTKSLAVEWAKYGIRVNAISPGYIATRLLEPASSLHPTWKEKTPMGRFGDPEDIAEAVVYLASSKAKFVTGADFVIDGGYSCP